MKKTLLAAALAVAAFNASAAGLGAGIVIGGGATGFAGAVSGNAYSNSTGSAVAASQVNGYGSSFQHTDGFTGGTATIGGVVNQNGAQVVTGATQVAQVNSVGNVTGNAPINVGNAIANGTAGFSETKVGSYGTANFQTGAIGGLAGFGGVVGFGNF